MGGAARQQGSTPPRGVIERPYLCVTLQQRAALVALNYLSASSNQALMQIATS